MSSLLGSIHNGSSYISRFSYDRSRSSYLRPRRPTKTGPAPVKSIQALRRSCARYQPYPIFSASAPSSSPTKDSVNSNGSQGLVGLRNLGNTCFMNSILQCLSNTQGLQDYCLDNSYSRDLNSSSNNTVLMNEFAKLMQTMWTSPGSSSKVVSPFEFKVQFKKVAPVFEGLNQHDAHEFLRYLLDGLHGEVNRVTVGPNASDAEDLDRLPDEEKGRRMWSKYLERENSKIVDLFAGQLKSSLTCGKCGFCATVFDPFWTLSLPIADGPMVSLMDCMRLFTDEDLLDGDERPTCSNCKARSSCTKKFTVQKFPKILVLHLKRFSSGGRRTTSSKLKTFVSFPVRNLDLREFASASGADEVVYNLHAVSTRSGTTRNNGHYTAYCRNPTSGQWYTFDDSRVTARALCNQVCSFEAYVLFYELASSRGEHSQIEGIINNG